MANFHIIHSAYSEASRNFVAQFITGVMTLATNGKDCYYDGLGNQFCVLDWYSTEDERFNRTCSCHTGQPHFGPPPGMHPEIHILLGNDANSSPVPSGINLIIPPGSYGYARVYNAGNITQAINSANWEAFVLYGQYIGGQTPAEVQQNLVGQPWAPPSVQKALQYLQNNPIAPLLPPLPPVTNPVTTVS
jgi:hypothetical protein